MNITAIVYTSNAGHTKEYAEMLGNAHGIKVYDLNTAKKELVSGAEIIYMGWLMAGQVKGYKEAAKLYNVRGVCGVGMAGGDGQLESIRRSNAVPEGTPVFCLCGGFEMDKLSGVYKMMMQVMKATAGKALAKKTDRTAEEDDMLDLMLNGGSRVSETELDKINAWLSEK